ncbi:MAG: hypothetical protein ABW189_00475 [Rickettsiales bacterium]
MNRRKTNAAYTRMAFAALLATLSLHSPMAEARRPLPAPAPSERFMATLYDAQIGLHNKDAVRSAACLSALEKTLQSSFAEKTQPSENVSNERKAVEVEFGATLTYESAVIPLRATNLTASSLKSDINIRGIENGGIKTASVRYGSFSLPIDAVMARLRAAQKELTEGDFLEAQYEASQIQRKIFTETSGLVPADVRARDHIALATYMVHKAEYRAARDALSRAEAAWKQMEGAKNVVGKAGDIKKEMSALEKTIDAKDPGLLDRLDRTLEEWWRKEATSSVHNRQIVT